MSNISGRNGNNSILTTPLNEGTRSGPEDSGVVPEADQTILKVTEVNISAPDPEVHEKPHRRRFSAAYKLKILKEAEQFTERGHLGALLRREGLYHSNIRTWRKARERGELKALSDKKRGRKAKSKNPLIKENSLLKRDNERLRDELRKAMIVIDVQKKISELLEIEQSVLGPGKMN